MTVGMEKCNPADYMNKDECEKTHAEKEKYYGEIIYQFKMDTRRLEEDTRKLEKEIDNYKDKINGKFDKIMYSIIGLLVMICMSAISTIYIQMVTKNDMDRKFTSAIEGKTYHQSISEANNANLSAVIEKLDDITAEIRKRK
jgi:hypothetical protein